MAGGAIEPLLLPCFPEKMRMSILPPHPEQMLCLARAGDQSARGQMLELYRNYLTLLARYQIGRRLQGKVDPSDLVQETFLEAHRDFGQFRGGTEPELVGWLRRNPGHQPGQPGGALLRGDHQRIARRVAAGRSGADVADPVKLAGDAVAD